MPRRLGHQRYPQDGPLTAAGPLREAERAPRVLRARARGPRRGRGKKHGACALMRVFRTKFGLCCALLALVAQIVVSFGHVHWHGSAPSPLRLAAADSPALTDSRGAPALPPGLAVDGCAACTLAGLGGLPASAPTLRLPRIALTTFHVSIDAPSLVASYRPFQSRA